MLHTRTMVRDGDPLEKTVSSERRTLKDLRSLLEDRGGTKTRNNVSNNSPYGIQNKSSDSNTWRCRDRRCFRFKTIVLFLVSVLVKCLILAEARSSGDSLEFLGEFEADAFCVAELTDYYKLLSRNASKAVALFLQL
ncbi:hypothetical protein ACJJTC_007479 [Scirpophaga incertulas]